MTVPLVCPPTNQLPAHASARAQEPDIGPDRMDHILAVWSRLTVTLRGLRTTS